MRAVIIFFAKAPDAGNVKTRLVPPLTAFEAAELHEAFVDDLVTRFQNIARFDVELHTDVSTDAWKALTVTRKLQISGSLGLKMFHSLSGALAAGYQRTAIVGSDAPTLPIGHVDRLIDTTAAVALGPADDGGFWGISASETNPRMFDGVEWSSPATLSQTVAAVQRAGLSVELAPNWFDVDEPADLDRLLAAADLPPATAEWVSRHRRAIEAWRATR